MSIALLEMLSSAMSSLWPVKFQLWCFGMQTKVPFTHITSAVYIYISIYIKRYSIYIYIYQIIYLSYCDFLNLNSLTEQQQQQQQVLCGLQRRAPQKKRKKKNSCVTIGPLNSSLNPKMLLPLSLGDSHTASTVSQWFHTDGIKALATCAKWCLI